MMPQATKEKSPFWTAFQKAMENPEREKLPSWVERLREGAIDRFEQLGFPTTDEEDWKYTNVAPLAKRNFAAVAADAIGPLHRDAIIPYVYPEARRSHLVFVDGIFRPDASSVEALPEGVWAGDLRRGLASEQAEVLREHLARAADDNRNGFAALNTAFLGGAFIYVPPGVRVASPVHLLFLSSAAGEESVATFPRALVVAGRGSELTIIESWEATGEAAYFTDAVTEVFVGEEARLVHYKIQRESDRSFHIASTHADLGRSSAYDLTTVTLGAELSRHDINVRLDQPGAECWVDGLYIVGTGQHADTHSLIDHRQPHCTSHQIYKGILDGKSRAVFNGKVFVHRDAQQTDARQTNKNLLLSSEARVDTKPQLEIYADDVKCAHGATVGQLEEEELFYLASRGLHPEIARNLLTYGFAEEIVEKIRIESIKKQLDEAILNRLHARLEV